MIDSPLIFEARTNCGVIELQGFSTPEAATQAAMMSLREDERLFSVKRKADSLNAAVAAGRERRFGGRVMLVEGRGG